MLLQFGNYVSNKCLVHNDHILLFALWWWEGFVDLPRFSQEEKIYFMYMIAEFTLSYFLGCKCEYVPAPPAPGSSCG